MEVNQKVVESRAKEAMLVEQIHRLCDFLVDELGRPATDLEAQAIAKLLGQHYDEAKALCLHDPCSPFLAAVFCLASAYQKLSQKLRHFSRSAVRSLKLLTTANSPVVRLSRSTYKFSHLQGQGGHRMV